MLIDTSNMINLNLFLHDETKLRITFKYFSEIKMDTDNEKISGDDNVGDIKRSLTEEITCEFCHNTILENSVCIKDIDDENVKSYTLQCTNLNETSLICNYHIAIFNTKNIHGSF